MVNVIGELLMDIINKNPDKEWDWYWILFNPNITWDIIESNPDKPWSWHWISQKLKLTWDIIESNPDKEWDSISYNPNLTYHRIYDISEKPLINKEILERIENERNIIVKMRLIKTKKN